MKVGTKCTVYFVLKWCFLVFLLLVFQVFTYYLESSLNGRIHVGWCPDMSTREIYLNIYKTNMDIND